MGRVLTLQGGVSSTEEAEQGISKRALARGLRTLDELKLEVLRQRSLWWDGSAYHCPLCDEDFTTPQRAAEHVVLEQHPVLRLDLMDGIPQAN